MRKNKPANLKLHPVLFAMVPFLFFLIATVSYTHYKQGLWEKDVRTNLLDLLIGKKSRLEKALYSRIYYTRGVAAFVALKPDITTEEFNELASEYIKNDSVIGTMALSRNCILNAIYPLKGHEAAIGLDLLKHPERKEIVEKTIETHQTFIAGPVKLVEGGIAFISYTPIFDKSSQNKDQFWGVTDIVVKEQSLLNETQFRSSENGFEFALRGYNGLGNNGAVFWGNPTIFDKNPVTIDIDLPIGSWVLAVVPAKGWKQYTNQDRAIFFILILSSFIISLLIGLITKALLKIRQNERELKAIFGSMDNLIVEFNSVGKYVKIAPTNDDILFRPKSELIGKNVHEIFEPEKADFFLQAIRRCLETRNVVEIEYPLEIKGKECWFSARINYKSGETVIFNAFDITEKKKDEEIIHQSGLRLKELNEMKDKFFSIIAHDLRNPVGNLKVMTDLILDEYESMTDNQRKELLGSMQSSSLNLHLLLEDLLKWSRTHSGNMVVNKQIIGLKELCDNLFAQIETEAQMKDIHLVNETDPTIKVMADSDLTGTILRNLVSNAIKFTQRGDKIWICSEEIIVDQKSFLKISVIDQGVGIKSDTLETIFRIDKTTSSRGTENEQGTGLGLILCKEFIEKQGGQIYVSSIYGEGSTFSVTLPLIN